MKPNKIPPTPKQPGHDAKHLDSPDTQAAKHNSDLAKVERLHQHGMPKK